MSKAVRNVMLRVIKKRLAAGETADAVFADYPRLSDADRQELEEALGMIKSKE